MNLLSTWKKNIQQTIKATLNQVQTPIVRITNHLYHIPYPYPVHLENLIKQFKKSYKPIIYNIGEYPYTVENVFGTNCQVVVRNCSYECYSGLPLCAAFGIIDQIHQLIGNEENSKYKNHDVYIHCQDNKSRSAIVLSLYLHRILKMQFLESIETINHLIGLKQNLFEKQTYFGTQHNIMKNINNYCLDPTFINKQQLQLIKIVINKTPILDNLDMNIKTQILIDIRNYKWKGGKTSYKRHIPCDIRNMTGFMLNFTSKQEDETKKLILSDDFVINLKYVQKNKAHPVLRVQLNTNFIFNNKISVKTIQLDFSEHCQKWLKNAEQRNDNTEMDFLFNTLQDKFSQLSLIKPVEEKSSKILEQKQQPIMVQDQQMSKKVQQHLVQLENSNKNTAKEQDFDIGIGQDEQLPGSKQQISEQSNKPQTVKIDEQTIQKLKKIEQDVQHSQDDEDDEQYFRKLQEGHI